MLLAKLVATRWFGGAAIAEALVVPEAMFDDYLAGIADIPLDRQLCLALFVIENVPALARSGHQLRSQVVAAAAFSERAANTGLQASSVARAGLY
jgi:hypothetical protein